MKWIVRWTDLEYEDREEVYDNIGDAITFIQGVSEEIERVRLFLDENHIATYYTPKKSYWT